MIANLSLQQPIEEEVRIELGYSIVILGFDRNVFWLIFLDGNIVSASRGQPLFQTEG